MSMLSRIPSTGEYGVYGVSVTGHSTAMLIPVSTYMRPNAGSGGYS